MRSTNHQVCQFDTKDKKIDDSFFFQATGLTSLFIQHDIDIEVVVNLKKEISNNNKKKRKGKWVHSLILFSRHHPALDLDFRLKLPLINLLPKQIPNFEKSNDDDVHLTQVDWLRKSCKQLV